MALPSTREEFKEHCLRKLGHPVIVVNLDDDQMEDRIDEGLQFFYEHHYDGVEKVYRKHQVTATDIANGYVTLPDAFIGVVRLFRLSGVGSAGMFNIQYQFMLNNIHNLSSTGMQYLEGAKQYMNMLADMLVGDKSLRFVRHKNQIKVDVDWSKTFSAGDWIVFEVYKRIDAEDNSEVWNDMFLKRYVTALFKRQWGSNLKKYSGVNMPGNVTFNGQAIFEEGKEEVQQLEDEVYDKWSTPPDFMTG